jgi:hypothetical protein
MSSLIANVCSAVMVCGVLAVGPQQSQNPVNRHRPVPEAAIAASQAKQPVLFGHALAALGIPAGFVLKNTEDAGDIIPVDPSAPAAHALTEALASFRRNHRDYRVDDSSDGLLLVSESSLCAPVLEEMVTLEAEGSYLEVLNRVAKAVLASNTDPRIPAGVVRVGADPSGTANAEAQLLMRPVKVRAVASPLRSVLLEMSRQAPGVIWSIVEMPAGEGQVGSCVVNLLTANHVSYTSYAVR